MATNNPISLLIGLGVDDNTSKANIQGYLDKIKKDLKLNVEVNATNGKNNGLEDMRKQIDVLQKQVIQLNKELSNVGSTKSSSINISQGIKKEVIESITSLDQLKKHVNSQNGDIKLKFTTDEKGIEKLESVIARVKTEANKVQETKIKPIVDTNGVIVGFNQIERMMHDVSSKDLRINVTKGIEELNKFARQGELSTAQYDKFRNSINSSIDNTGLNNILESMRSINKESTHENKMQNSMLNINKQAIDLSSKLNQFAKDKNSAFDSKVVDNFLNRLDKVASSNFNTITDMKSVNRDFSSVEKEINAYIKLQDKYKEVVNNLNLLQRQGKITANDFANFDKDAKLATTTTELSRLNKEISSFSKNTKIDTQVSNALKNIGTEVDQLNTKLKTVTNNFNISPNNPLFGKIKADIDSISDMKINAPKDIERMNKLITDTSKNIRQLGQESNNLKQFETKTREINNLLKQMKDSGLLTNNEINKFRNSLSRIESGNLAHINNLLTQMGTKFDKLKDKQKINDTFDKQQSSLSRLNSELTRTEKLFPRSMDKSKVAELRAEIERLNKLNILNPVSLKNNQKEIDVLKDKVKQFGAEATQAGRSSTGVLSDFKNAMQKFPIWIN